jgi:hypothetical protein
MDGPQELFQRKDSSLSRKKFPALFKTSVLVSEGYWGSYNIPVYDYLSEASGYKKLCSLDASRCHDSAPRAYLFNDNVTSVQSGEWILSFNFFQTDDDASFVRCNRVQGRS